MSAKEDECYWGTGCAVKGRQCTSCIVFDARAEGAAEERERLLTEIERKVNARIIAGHGVLDWHATWAVLAVELRARGEKKEES